MEETIVDAKQDGIPDVAGEVSSPNSETTLIPIVSDDGLISTTEYEKPEPVEEIISEETEQKTETDTLKDKDFNEHPRFKELIDQKNQFKEAADKIPALEQKIADLEKAPDTQFDNIMSRDDDQIIDDFTNSPKKFLANFAQQLWSEFGNRQQSIQSEQDQRAIQERSNKTLQEFFDGKDDGIAMLNDGRIEKFIADNPGHNAISAYHELSGDSQYKTLVEEAVKTEREKIYKELKAKGNARSFSPGTGGSHKRSNKSPEMLNPDKFGGRTNVLLQRMQKRQAEG